MRVPLVLACLAVAATLAGTASAAFDCGSGVQVCIRGTLAGWIAPVETADPGAKARFVSADGFDHPPVVQRPDGARLAPDLGTADTFTFADAGTYSFRCGVHGWMIGRVVVG